jgi:hypothetical protein
MTVALLSACLGLAACAQNQANRSPSTAPNPDKAQTAPSPGAVQQQQANPSNENMDANAQRAHSRASGSTPSSSTGKTTSQPGAGEVRDWRAIDKNHDNLIQPEEMEAELKAGKSGSSKQ